MIGNPRERWQLLCEQAAKESNSAKLLAMVREINDLIDAKYGRARPALVIPVVGEPDQEQVQEQELDRGTNRSRQSR